MKVLQLCHKPPYPETDGGCLAINQLTQALIDQGCDVTIVSIATPKHPYNPKKFPKGYVQNTKFKAVFIDTRLNVVDAFSNLITQDTYHVSRFFSSDMDKAIDEVLGDQVFDVVIFESIFVAPYLPAIRRLSKAKVVLRSHNLEFSIWHRLAKSQPKGLKKAYLKILTKQLKDYEVNLLDQIDGLIAINSDELKHYRRLGFLGKGITVPFGIDPDLYTPSHQNLDKNSVFHLGSMDWKPNEEGIDWFLHEVWPLVYAKNPDLTFYLAGRRIPKWLDLIEIKGVSIVGEVPDAKTFMSSKNIMIIPLMSGGGMRVKLIEALALEKPVVSTPLGAKGVSVSHNQTIKLATKPREFADAILALAANNEEAEGLGRAGRELIVNKYDHKKLAFQLHGFLTKLLA